MGFLGPKKNLRMKNLKSKNCLKDLEIGKLFKKTIILKNYLKTRNVRNHLRKQNKDEEFGDLTLSKKKQLEELLIK